MSKCIYCGKQTEISQRGFAKKYCSAICGERYRNWKKTGKRIDPNYIVGSKTKEKKEKARKMQEKYKWYFENWVSIKTIMKELNIKRGKVFYISKALEIKYEVIRGGIKGRRDETFFRPEDVEKIKIGLVKTPVPDGFLDSEQAAKHLGYSFNAFKQKDRTGLSYTEFRPKSWAKKYIIKIYKLEDLEKWHKKLSEKRALEVEENKKLRMKETRERKAQKEKEKQEKFDRETFGLINQKDACKMLGIGTIGNYAKKLSPKVIKGCQSRNWYDPKKVEQLAKELEEFRNRERKKQYIVREISHTAPEAYEKRLLERKFPLWQSDPFKVDSIVLNKKWHNNRINLGLVKKLHCGKCDQDLPYYNFTYSSSYRGRQPHCRECVKQTHINTYDPECQRQLRKKNYVQRFRSIITTQIKRDMSMVVGEYQDLTTEEIWKYIENTLGYTAKDLCDHLESQFTPQMNWDSHLRSTEGFRWEMDHIIPRSKLKYDSLNHPNFAKCWDLANLRPLEHKENKIRDYD